MDADHDMLGILDHRPRLDVDEITTETRRIEIEAVLEHRVAAGTRLFDQREEGAVDGNHLLQPLPAQMLGTAVEELLAGVVDMDDGMVAVDDDHGQREGVEHGIRFEAAGRPLSFEGYYFLGHFKLPYGR